MLASSGLLVSPLAGCLNNDEGTNRTNGDHSEGDSTDRSDPDCDPPNRSEPDNVPGEGFPSIELFADESDRDHIVITASLARHFDATGPAQIEIAVTNDSDEERQFTFLDWAPFPAYTGFHSDEETGLLVVPESGYQIDSPDGPTGGCWHLDDPPAASDVEETVDVEPCETVADTYDVYHVSGENCLKEGEYEFEVPDVGEQGHEWGFTVRLEYP